MKNNLFFISVILFTCSFVFSEKNSMAQYSLDQKENERITSRKIDSLLKIMTLDEKIGQMSQRNERYGHDSLIRVGMIGSLLNVVDAEATNRLQRIAVEESRLGIPLIIGRDIVHGFKTIMPVPLGQAATWNPELIEQGARVAAVEARKYGVRWTFAPVLDITRDPRWGRIVETFGEDPFLTSKLGVATIRGFQGNSLSDKTSIAACAKHFAAYGAAEGGRDYNTVTLPENELRDVYLAPFKACVDEGIATFMTAFNELNGVPASGNKFLFRNVLRNDWNYKGFVVSDWASIEQMIDHGFVKDRKEAAHKAVLAGVDMEMATTTYADHVKELIVTREITEGLIDESVRNILRVKFKLGLFEDPYVHPDQYPEIFNAHHQKVALELARQSIVLLKNEASTLPLQKETGKVAVIGPLADAPHEQMGSWIFDGEEKFTITPLQAIRTYLGNSKVNYAPGMRISRTRHKKGFAKAIAAARNSDAVLLFLGEESILSGEAHCRADLSLPGAQEELVNELSKTGKPIVAIILSGRPNTFERIIDKLDAVLYAWHPGTMGGEAIKDILFGLEAPSGKLPVTFPRVAGQIPIYYSHKNSGRPASDASWNRMYEIPEKAIQYSLGNTNHYIDYGLEPMYPFGYGLSYTTFKYSDITTSADIISLNDTLRVSAKIKNTGNYDANEIVQLYVRDLVGSRTRPVKELKGFQRIYLKAGEEKVVTFSLHTNDLEFYDPNMQKVTEPGDFDIWVGGSSKADLKTTFTIK